MPRRSASVTLVTVARASSTRRISDTSSTCGTAAPREASSRVPMMLRLPGTGTSRTSMGSAAAMNSGRERRRESDDMGMISTVGTGANSGHRAAD